MCICSNIVLCVCVCFMHTRCARINASFISDHVSDVLFCMFAQTYIYNLSWSCFVFPPVPRTKGLGLTFTSAHVLIRALVDGPSSQPTDTMDHIKCVVRALVPILAVSLPHVCVSSPRDWTVATGSHLQQDMDIPQATPEPSVLFITNWTSTLAINVHSIRLSSVSVTARIWRPARQLS